MPNRKPLVVVNSYLTPMRAGDTLVDGTGMAFAAAAQPGARVWSDASLIISSLTLVAVPFNQERYDSGGLHDNTVNNTRITASKSGIYHIGANLYLYPAVPLNQGALVVYLRIRKLDGTFRWIAGQSTQVPSTYSSPAGDFVWHCCVHGVQKMEAAEYVECVVANWTSGTVTAVAVSGANSSARLQYFQDFFIQRLAD